jgi:hypothetical protein
MPSHTENLTALLDLGRDTLPEGDYLKLANFLKTINKPDAPVILSTYVRELNQIVKFRGYRQPADALTTIRMISTTTTTYDGPRANLYTLKYQMNNEQPISKPIHEFESYVRQLTRRYGMKDIQIETPDMPVEMYSCFAEFKKNILILGLEDDKATHMALYGDLDEFESDPACDEYIYGLLFGYSRC